MAKRRKKEDSASLDSLLDTMTNVVGILVILLVLTQLGSSEAMDRIRESAMAYEDVSVEALQEMEQRAEELKKLLEEYKELAAGLDAQIELDQIDMAKVKREIDRLRELVKMDPGVQAQLDEAKALVEQRRKALEELQKKLSATQQQLADLRAVLARTPEPKDIPPSVVTLPDPREAPRNAKPVYFIVREGKLYPLDVDALLELAQRKARPLLRSRYMIAEDDENTGGIDEQALIDRFDNAPVRNPWYDLSIKIYYNEIPYLMFNRKPDAGLTAEELAKPGSSYRRMLSQVLRGRDYARFLVWPDGFETYLAAREVADEMNVPAGWQLQYGSTEYHVRLGHPEFKTNRSKEAIRLAEEEAKRKAAEAAARPKPTTPPPTAPPIPPPVKREMPASQID